MKVLGLMLMLALGVQGDMFLHNPRGSNDRLDETGRERNNAKRLFDSQNNNRGGYNVGSIAYTSGSILQVEWTNQHSCADPNANCEIILQYMCEDRLRDGSNTGTIPTNSDNCVNFDCNNDYKYGMHEDSDYYLVCKTTFQQQNLFTADQALTKKTAISTRQNPGGTRRGFECPEERDYYPYWRPSPWKDIAVLTNEPSRCPYYQAESANVKSRFYCDIPGRITSLVEIQAGPPTIPITRDECENYSYEDLVGTWTEFPAHGTAAPECRESHWSRDNHLGNSVNGQTLSYNWTVPDIEHEKCTLRIRYNISTGEYDGWDGSVTAAQNAKNGQESTLDVYSKFGFADAQAAAARGYVYQTNPVIDLFGNVPGINANIFNLRLAINTAQFGRTFQDRSHSFAIRQRTADIPSSAVIKNLNVRGKRGNIVETFPATEYDFVPNTIETTPGEYIHIQWTGSETNPDGNDGQGKKGTDRNNLILLKAEVYPEGGTTYYDSYTKYGQFGNSYPEQLDNINFLGFDRDTLEDLATLKTNQFGGEMSVLDDAGTYYDAKPRKVTETGYYQYMCTRNNNFSNRSQKGRIVSKNLATTYNSVGAAGGVVKSRNSNISFKRGVLDHLVDIKIEEWTIECGEQYIKEKGGKNVPGDHIDSNYLVIWPTDKITVGDEKFTVRMKVTNPRALDKIRVYRSDPDTLDSWEEVKIKFEDGDVVFTAEQGGAYGTSGQLNGGAVAGIVLAAAGLLLVLAGSVSVVVIKKSRKSETTDSTDEDRGFENPSSESKQDEDTPA